MTLELDLRRSPVPLPVVIRWLLKRLLRTFRVRVTEVRLDDAKTEPFVGPWLDDRAADGRLDAGNR